ncbi:hypothetical protein [Saccharibacillus sacchari]|uniref:hypothetical protein n=1 Tax=Saccharibacillus sacchari TaxID=456493 RepID=UPI0004B163C1|nr:hypothetical protein [Saccharibacillus sacchari]
MGVTIFYKGTLKSIEDREALIEKVKVFCAEQGWPYEEIDEARKIGVWADPHPESESLGFVFDGKLRMDGFTKTAFAPDEIHGRIVELLYAVKPHFKRLTVLDEAEMWDDYVERMNPSKKKTFVYKEIELTEQQRREAETNEGSEVEVDPRSARQEIDTEFWGMTEDWYDPPHFSLPAIRDKMRRDLSQGNRHLLTIAELKEIAESKRGQYFEVRPGAPEMTMMSLAELWASEYAVVKGARSRQSRDLRLVIFASMLSNAFFGLFGGMYDRNWHRKAFLFKDEFLDRHKDSATPLRSMIFFYSLLDVLNMELKETGKEGDSSP